MKIKPHLLHPEKKGSDSHIHVSSNVLNAGTLDSLSFGFVKVNKTSVCPHFGNTQHNAGFDS